MGSHSSKINNSGFARHRRRHAWEPQEDNRREMNPPGVPLAGKSGAQHEQQKCGDVHGYSIFKESWRRAKKVIINSHNCLLNKTLVVKLRYRVQNGSCSPMDVARADWIGIQFFKKIKNQYWIRLSQIVWKRMLLSFFESINVKFWKAQNCLKGQL